MSAPTIDDTFPTVTTVGHFRAARVRFCDRDDADMFLEWLRVRSESLQSGVTFPLFVCTAADAYSLSSALTYAVFGEVTTDELPAPTQRSIVHADLPAVLGPFDVSGESEVMFVISRR